MKVEHADLWRYEELREATDCDGRHESSREYLSHKDPSDIVYSKADLFAPGAPSRASLREGSDQNKGSAYIGHAAEEGGVSWDVYWTRVSNKESLDEYLKEIEDDLVTIFDFEVEALYRARVRTNIRSVFPEATGIAVDPASVKGEPWSITDVFGGDAWKPTTIWSGDGTQMPFTAEVIREVSRDLEKLYANQIVEDDAFVRLV